MTIPGLRYLIMMGGFVLFAFRDAMFGTLAVVLDYHNAPSKWWWGEPFRGYRPTFVISIAALVALAMQSRRFEIGRVLRSPIMITLGVLLLCIAVRFSVYSPVDHARLLDKDLKSALMAILIASTVNTTGRMRLFLWVMVIGCWGVGIEAWRNPRREAGRLYGVGMPDAFGENALAAHLALTIPFLMDRVIRGVRWEKVLAIPAAAFIANCIVLTSSRGAMLASVMAGAVYFVGVARQPKHRKAAMIVGVIGILGAVSLMDQVFLDRMATIIGAEDEFSGEREEVTGAGRTEIWAAGIPIVSEHPFGLGGGGFRTISPNYLPAEALTADPRTGRATRAAHNTYLLVAADFGLHGFAAFMLLLFFMGRTVWRGCRERLEDDADPGRATYSLILGSMLAALMTTFMFTNRLHYEGFFYLIGLTTGLAVWKRTDASTEVVAGASARSGPVTWRAVRIDDADHVAGIPIRAIVIALACSLIMLL